MENFKIFLDLTRLKKPIGFMLLFWPCIWGLTLGFDFNENINFYVKYLILFFFGAVLMRSAGCIINDVFDKDFDKAVARTKHRPIPSGKITVKTSLFLAALLCLLAFIVLIQFNFIIIILAFLSMPFAFTYPLMKRYTYWPQLFLGLTFNYGLILGWFCFNETFSFIPLIFYLGAIFWTLGYDTIYGFQDIKDDEIIGVKSTSIKFKKNPKIFIFLCYLFFFLILTYLGFLMKFDYLYFIGIILVGSHLFFYQSIKLNTNDSKNCLERFKSNNFLGLLIFIIILIAKII